MQISQTALAEELILQPKAENTVFPQKKESREYSLSSTDFSPVSDRSNTLEYINLDVKLKYCIDSVNCNHTIEIFCRQYVHLSHTRIQ